MGLTCECVPRTVRRVSATEPDDVVLLARIRAGDDSALESAYDQHADLVFGIARRVTRDDQLARDVTQEVFVHLWQRSERIDPTRGSLRGFLGMLAHRRAVDEVRRNERRRRLEAGLAGREAEDGPEEGVVETLSAAWRHSRLAKALDALPAEQRAAIELAYYDGLTYRQVATVLGVPEGTAKSRLRLAMARLRAVLADELQAPIS